MSLDHPVTGAHPDEWCAGQGLKTGSGEGGMMYIAFHGFRGVNTPTMTECKLLT